MRILLLTTSFPLNRNSVSGIFIRKMIEQLPSEFQVTVLTPDSALKSISQFEEFSLVRFRYAPRAWQRLAHGSGGIVAALGQRNISCLLIPVFLCSNLITACWLARKADILHANWSLNGVVAGFAGILMKKPVITTLRGSDVHLMERSGLMRWLVGCCLRWSHCVVTVSPSLKNVIKNEFPRFRDKIRIIPNGIDELFFVPHKKNVQEFRGVRFLYVGNLTEGKEVHTILEAARRLSVHNWTLDVVGDGPKRKKLEEYSLDTIGGCKVFFHGAVIPKFVPGFMQGADVFVFASASEGRPNVILEAMAAGLSIIASSIPSVRELIQDGREGLLFPVGDAEKLKNLMEYVICHPRERKKMGRNAREHISTLGLSWQKTARQYAAVYTSVLQPSGGK